MRTEQARAKLNLYLHILGRRADGYHMLESLVVFTDLADALQVEAAEALSLTLDGEFAVAAGSEHNLVLKAARALQKTTATNHGAALKLTKNIPVGAGLGGGSADAAATLRALNAFWQLGLTDQQLYPIAASLGADVAMCLASHPAIARGIGELLEPLPITLPPLHAVLVYPRQPALTAEVYQRYTSDRISPSPRWHEGNFFAALAPARNDLQRAAITVCPEIAEVLLVLETMFPPSPYVRMTGSGACCFALYETAEEASHALAALKKDYPQWWVRNVQVTN